MNHVPGRKVLGREGLVALSSLLGVAALAWIYLWREAVRMASMHAESATAAGSAAEAAASRTWSVEWLLLTFVMWTIMMVAMMLPSAAPTIVLYASMVRRNRERGSILAPVWVFTAGYLAVWTAFSLAATVLQAVLQAGSLVTSMMVSNSQLLSGLLLVVAGIYQWLPAKDACLNKCRNPLQFFLFRWRPGATGALRMGFESGAYCAGCCWALMLLLFTAGVMNLLWVAAIAGYVLLEKVLPGARLTGRLIGAALVAAGGVIIA